MRLDRPGRSRLVPWLKRGGELRFVATIVLVGALVRVLLLVFAVQRGWVQPLIDETKVASALIEGKGYAWNGFQLPGDTPIHGAFYPPAYVYNVYILQYVFRSDLAIYIQNVLMSLGVAILLYLIAKRITGQTGSRIVLLLSMFYVPFFNRITHGSPVCFKMFFMTLCVFLLYRAWNAPSTKKFAISGVVAGVLALSMPDFLVYVLLIGAAMILLRRKMQFGIRHVVVFWLVTGAVILPWTARNWIEFRRFCPISTNGGINFYFGNNPNSIGEVTVPSSKVTIPLDEALEGELSRADEFRRDRILYREGFRYIQQHPYLTISRMLKRAAFHWTFRPSILRTFAGDSTYSSHWDVYVWTYIILYVPLLLVTIFGLHAYRHKLREFAPLWLTFVYSTLVTTVFVVQTKQRLIKVEPFMVVFAGLALADWLGKRPVSRSGTSEQAIDEGVSPQNLISSDQWTG